jgi:hypothetical protein
VCQFTGLLPGTAKMAVLVALTAFFPYFLLLCQVFQVKIELVSKYVKTSKNPYFSVFYI